MIYEIMAQIKNHFIRTLESSTSYAIVADGIEGSFSRTYITGQKIMIETEFGINDGVYTVASATGSKITVDEAMTAEPASMTYVYGLRVTPDFLSIVSEIETWQTNNGGHEGVASEKIDDYSIANEAGGSSWTTAFRSRLNSYRKMSDDRRRFLRHNCVN